MTNARVYYALSSRVVRDRMDLYDMAFCYKGTFYVVKWQAVWSSFLISRHGAGSTPCMNSVYPDNVCGFVRRHWLGCHTEVRFARSIPSFPVSRRWCWAVHATVPLPCLPRGAGDFGCIFLYCCPVKPAYNNISSINLFINIRLSHRATGGGVSSFSPISSGKWGP